MDYQRARLGAHVVNPPGAAHYHFLTREAGERVV